MCPITNKINEIIDRRIGRNGFEGKGHLEAIRKKKAFFEGLMQTLLDYQALRENVLAQINAQKGKYYAMSMEDPTLQQKMELIERAGVDELLVIPFSREMAATSAMTRVTESRTLTYIPIMDAKDWITTAFCPRRSSMFSVRVLTFAAPSSAMPGTGYTTIEVKSALP